MPRGRDTRAHRTGTQRASVRGRWGAVIVAAVVGVACTNGGSSPATTAQGSLASPRTIPQPEVSGVAVAPPADRVDVVVPTFSHPTEVTNPLFPVSRQASVLFVGHVDAKPFRTEVTLLPSTRIVEWEGQRIETLVSQYCAYLDGRIQEVAYDLYAQADDGSVWYFGEDVADLAHGDIVTKEGTWIVGKDGPAAMIMPDHPTVGDAYRTENIPGIAFEQVTVTSVDTTLDGPLGPIPGGLVGQELHMDGATEDKLFAPGYGEFYTADGPDVEALALAMPTDAAAGPMPPELTRMTSDAMGVFAAVGTGSWGSASAAVADMRSAWAPVKAGGVPRLLEPRVARSVRRLADAVGARSHGRARAAAIEAARWSLDLQLRYRPPFEIDIARFGLWAAQLQADAEAHDASAVNGDIFTLHYIRDRILTHVDATTLTAINTEIGNLWTAAADRDFTAAARSAGRLRSAVGA